MKEFEGDNEGDTRSYHKIKQESDDIYSTDYGWGLYKGDDSDGGTKGSKYCRTYKWNERNQLISSVDSNYNTAYIYGQDGQRSNKYTQNSETLYFNKMWTLHTDSGNNVYGGQSAKNIYLGETRIVTKLNSGTNPTYQEEYYKQYYYHSDHLGSASLISDYKGEEYQRIEYTPYGEIWVEKSAPNANLNFLPYKFTAKEMDEETGLYYYGARYLDPRYSMWISTDPALGEYIPQAPIDEEAKKYNQNLPGMGGVFNHINGNLYHYAGNNPVKYTDPDGNSSINIQQQLLTINENGNRPGRKLNSAKSVVMHWTGVPGQTAQQTRNFFGLPSTGTSAHYVVGQEGEIIQMIPDDEVAYHAGGVGNALTEFASNNYKTPNGNIAPNLYTIGIEVNPEKADGSYSKAAYKSSASLAAKVLNNNGLGSILGVLFKGNLVRHGDITGKNCPKKFMDNNFSWFYFKISVCFELLKLKIKGSEE